MDLVTIVGLFESIATVAAIVVGGFWTYMLFVKRRMTFPKASLVNDVLVTTLPSGQAVLHVQTRIGNTGDVLLRLAFVRTRIQMVQPVDPAVQVLLDGDRSQHPDSEFPWPVLSAYQWDLDPRDAEVEPGETQTFEAEFVVNSSVRRVLVYTWVKNVTKRKRDLGWSCSSFVDTTQQLDGITMQTLSDHPVSKKQIPEQTRAKPDPSGPRPTPQTPIKQDPPTRQTPMKPDPTPPGPKKHQSR